MEGEQPVKILLVDDRSENLLAFEAVLASPSYDLIKATSGKEALSAILKHEFAAILLDVQMPEMTGFDTAVLIRQREKSREVPIIFVSATYKDANSQYQAYQAGGVDYLVKPFEPEVLRAKVRTFATLYRRRKEAEERVERERTESQRKLALLLEENENLFRDLVDHMEHGIVWVAEAETLRFSYVSRAAESVLGYNQIDGLRTQNSVENVSLGKTMSTL